MPQSDPEAARRFAIDVVQQLRGSGYQALWAGGCVRDDLLGLVPKDYDVATDATPEEIRSVFGQRRTLAIGAAFGVITVLGPKRAGQIEVATFRKDAEYSDGRHPDGVVYTDAREDALRRDFTINGLFWDPIDRKVIDFVGGQQDLAARRVRAIGNPSDRFGEDKLRMLRAVRFTAVYDFELEPSTLDAIQQNADTISVVSAERISDEFRRMLRHANRRQAVALLLDTNLLSTLLPEFTSKSPTNMLAILGKLKQPSFSTAFAALLREVATGQAQLDAARNISQRWKLSKDETEGILYCLRNERVIRHAPQTSWARLQPVLNDTRVQELMIFAEAVTSQLDDSTAAIEFCKTKLALPPHEFNPEPLISGDDLKVAGIPAGPIYRKILQAVRDAQLLGEIKDRASALALADEIRAEKRSP